MLTNRSTFRLYAMQKGDAKGRKDQDALYVLYFLTSKTKQPDNAPSYSKMVFNEDLTSVDSPYSSDSKRKDSAPRVSRGKESGRRRRRKALLTVLKDNVNH